MTRVFKHRCNQLTGDESLMQKCDWNNTQELRKHHCFSLEDCTGFKLKPEPEIVWPDPTRARARDRLTRPEPEPEIVRPDPSRARTRDRPTRPEPSPNPRSSDDRPEPSPNPRSSDPTRPEPEHEIVWPDPTEPEIVWPDPTRARTQDRLTRPEPEPEIVWPDPTRARTQIVWPDPSPNPRSSDPTRPEPEPEIVWPDPSPNPTFEVFFFFFSQRIANYKNKRCCISRLHATVSKQIHVKKQIHRGSATSQGTRKNTYQLWKIINIRCSGHINSAEFLNGCVWQDDNSSTVQIMVIFVS